MTEAGAGDRGSSSEPEGGEYRIEDLARVTGTTVRTLHAYRNRRLLPPPRRQGRIALYSREHVERIELIGELIGRGYSLNAVAELLEGLGRGDRIHDLLGLEESIGPEAEPQPLQFTPRDYSPLLDDPNVVASLVDLGVIEAVAAEFDGDPIDRPFVLRAPRVWDSGVALLATGIPLSAVFAEGARLQADADEIAKRFVQLALDHVIEEGAVGPSGRAASVTELVTRLVPFAPIVVGEYVRLALQRRIQDEVESQLDHLLDEPPPPADA